MMSIRLLIMLFFLYAIQGIPYGIQSRFLPIYLRSQSFSLTCLGLMKLLYVPWVLKTFYAPLVDIYWTKITWLKMSVFLLFLNATCMSTIDCNSTFLLVTLLFSFNLFCATQDISLDGIMIAHLTASELSLGNIAQVVGYKIGAIIGGGVLVILSYYFNWHFLFVIISCIYLIGFLSIFFLSDILVSKSVSSSKNYFQLNMISYCDMFKACFKTNGTKCLCILVFLYKLGEQGAMNLFPLYLFDSGRDLNEIGLWTGIVGQVVSICGSSSAAILFKNKSLWSNLYIMSIISIPLQFMFVLFIPTFVADSSLYFYFSVLVVNALLFVSGFRTTTAFSLMMKSSQLAPANIQSTHYTLLATIEVLGKLLFGTFVGFFADLFGYFTSYCLFFILSILLLCFLKYFRNDILSIEQNCCLENSK